MKYGKFYSNKLLATMQQINITKARKLYNEGVTVYILQCNMIFDNIWQSPYGMNINDNISTTNFDYRVIEYRSYNCDTQRGLYPVFFVKVEKQ